MPKKLNRNPNPPSPAPTGSPSGIEADVCADIQARQQKGIAKYGATVANNPLPVKAWLQHAYEECLDEAVYLKRAIRGMDDNQGWRDKLRALALMVDLFCAAIETGILPRPGSDCHVIARKLADPFQFKRKRMKLDKRGGKYVLNSDPKIEIWNLSKFQNEGK